MPAEFVTITVSTGADETEFVLHKNMICDHSPFFKAAFTGMFKEGSTQAMTLEDVGSASFGLLVRWLYTKEVYVCEPGEEKLAQNGGTNILETSIIHLTDLYLLAERFIMPILQDMAMDYLCDFMRHHNATILLPFVSYIYSKDDIENEHTLKDQAITFLVAYASRDKLAGWRKELPGEVAWDLMLAHHTNSASASAAW